MIHPASLGDWLHEHGDELVAVRRHLHAHPELSWEEHATTQLVTERLGLAGLAPKVLSTGTGLLCDIEPADPRAAGLPRVALRADLDALAMDDEKDVHYRSRTPGVAHACGHDVHTAAVLGAGLYLAHHPQVLTRPVRLVFQPAEEKLPGGAVAVINEGALDGVDSIYGVHCDPKLDAGTVGLKVGEISSAADRIEIRLGGPGGHTARPEQTVDMVRLAASLVTGVPEIVDLQLAAMGHTEDGGRHFAKVVFGAVHAGEASNVIPTHAVLRGSVRTPSLAAWDVLPDLVEAAVRQVINDAGVWSALPATYELDYVKGVPPVVNHRATTELVERLAREELGPHAIRPTVQSWGGDDFAWYLRQVPGTFIRLGVHDPDSGRPHLDLHVGNFDVDERAIAVGIRVLVAVALGSTEDVTPG